MIRYHPCLVLNEGLQYTRIRWFVRFSVSNIVSLVSTLVVTELKLVEKSPQESFLPRAHTHLCAFRSSLRTLPFTAGIIFPFPTLTLSNPHALTAIAAPTHPPRPTRRMHLPTPRSMATTASALRLARNFRVDSPPLGRMTAAIAARRTV